MSKPFLLVLVVCSLLLDGCGDGDATSSVDQPATAEATILRANNQALIKSIRKLQAYANGLEAVPVAGRAQATPIEYAAADIDFAEMKTQAVAALRASGACEGWIRFVGDLIDLLEDLSKENTSGWTEADAMAWSARFKSTFSSVLACLEPMIGKIDAMSSSETEANPFALDDLRAFDQCMCGYSGGSIFGTSAALVYSTYGAPESGSTYSAPGSPAGDTYSAPSSPAGETYGAPSLFP